MPSSPSTIARELARSFSTARHEKKEVSEKEAIKVSGAVSSVAFFYEKIRNVIDYKEDHLFCQSAIERNLQRLGFPHRLKNYLAEILIKDLVRAGYFATNTLPQTKIAAVDRILQKYHRIAEHLPASVTDKISTASWLTNVAAAEIEVILSPDPEDEAMVSAFFQLLLPNIKENGEPGETRRLLTYLAAKRTLLKSSRATLRYSLLLGYFPDWAEAQITDFTGLAEQLPATIAKIESHLNSPHLDRLQLFLRRFTAPFLILKDVLAAAPDPAGLLDDTAALDQSVREACEHRYRQIRTKLTRAATRSIIYIFLTKMVLALILELPFDLLVAREIRTLPLVVNTLFPPFLMFALTLSIPKPGEKNTRRIINEIREIIYSGTFNTPTFVIGNKGANPHRLRRRVFRTLYLATSVLTFALIIWLLSLLNFNVFSIIIFLFFITVVSFFAYRIGQSAREIVIEEKETTLSALVDFFMIPILRTGRQLSSQLSKINIFNFLLDFVIEAPLKSILEIAEDWLGFVREKKEEVAG